MKSININTTLGRISISVLTVFTTLCTLSPAFAAVRSFNLGNDTLGATGSIESIETIGDPYCLTLKGSADSKLLGTTHRVIEVQSKVAVDSLSAGRATGFLKAHGETVRSWDVGFTASATWNTIPVTVDGPGGSGSFLGFDLTLTTRATLSATGKATVTAQRNARPKVSITFSPKVEVCLLASVAKELPFGFSATVSSTGANGKGCYRLFGFSPTASLSIVPRPTPLTTLRTVKVTGYLDAPLGNIIVTLRSPFGVSKVPFFAWKGGRTSFQLPPAIL